MGDMKLFTKQEIEKLKQNHQVNATKASRTIDIKPVVKVFGGSACTWLFTEYDEEGGVLYGLCDLGMGEPEIGYVSVEELLSVRFKPFNLPVERDRWFTARKTLSEYYEEAKINRRIIT
jgi:hypothetical protein